MSVQTHREHVIDVHTVTYFTDACDVICNVCTYLYVNICKVMYQHVHTITYFTNVCTSTSVKHGTSVTDGYRF